MGQVVKLENAERIITDWKKCRAEGRRCEDCFLSKGEYSHSDCFRLYRAAKELLDRTNGVQLYPFKVRIAETYTHEDTVMAKDWMDARKQVEELWDEGEYETTGDQFTDVEYFVEEEQK